MGRFDRVRKGLLRPSTISVLILVLIGGFIAESETVRDHFPFIVTAELEMHQALARADPRRPRVRLMAVMEIDDATFWHPPLSGIEPLNRRFIADLALNAAAGGALLIAIDVPLRNYAAPGDQASRALDDEYLSRAIESIAARHIPVVLTVTLAETVAGPEWAGMPKLMPQNQMPPETVVGHVHVPRDPREIQLNITALSSDGERDVTLDSFAMASVDGYERETHIVPPTRSDRIIVKAMRRDQFVYGGFLRTDAFPHVSARRLWLGEPAAKAVCRNRIVIIGRNWHRDGPALGPMVETYDSPVGEIAGAYLHANYIEALMDKRFHAAVPLWLTMLIEFVAGLMLYGAYHAMDGTRFALEMVGIVIVLAMVAYLMFANVGLYLDFVPILIGVFVHLAYEHATTFAVSAWHRTLGKIRIPFRRARSK